MLWCDFYDSFWDWSDSTRRTRISSLEDIGPGNEVVECLLEIDNEKLRAQLLRKAMNLGAAFSGEDFMDLDGEIPPDLYVQLGRYAGFDHNDPYFDEDHMEWDDFYGAYSDWDEALCEKRVHKLKRFGPADEVCEAIQGMPTLALEDLLYRKAVAAGVAFSRSQKEEMGYWADTVKEALETTLADEEIDQFVADAETLAADYESTQRRDRRLGFWGVLMGVLGGLHHGASKRRSHSCDGDCAHCPAHYGYRYGRWYYGHGHQYGCERGGNGGATGKHPG